MFSHAVDSSFGGISKFYSVAGLGLTAYLRQYLSACGAAVLPTAAMAGYFAWKLRDSNRRVVRFLPIALILAYLLVCALTRMNDFRYASPAMLALPFLLAVVPPASGTPPSPGPPVFWPGMLAGVLVSIPMLARPDLTYVRYAGAVLDRIAHPGTRIVLVTDDPFLNIETFLLAKEIRGQSLHDTDIDTLVYDSIQGRSLDSSYHRMDSFDYILYRKPPLSTDPVWANQYADAFYQHALGIADPVDVPSEFMLVLKVRHEATR
jgi:hypothetical protein